MNAANDRLMRRATYAAVAAAGLLIVAKLGAWLATGSVALLTSLVDSALDAGASLLNLFAVRQALTPADAEHRFGHGKAEPIAGLAQGAFVAGSAVFVLFEAAQRLVRPQAVEQGAVGLAVMALSIAVTLALVAYQRRVVRRTGSLAIGADSLHYAGDLAMNLSIVVAILLAWGIGWQWADPVFAIAIALWLMKSAGGIFRRSFDQLMDREFPEEVRERIKRVVMGHGEARAIHDLRTRSSGTHAFIQFHLELDPEMTLARAHDIADRIEAELMAAFPNAEIIIHQDPAGLEAPPVFARAQ